MSAKLAIPDILEIKVFLNKVYDVIISVHKVISKILSRDANYIVAVVMCQLNFCKDLTRKNNFLRGGLRSISIIWDL